MKENKLKNKPSQRSSATLIALAVCFIVVFSIGFTSAFEFDNVKNSRDITFDGKAILGNELLERYKPIEIKNAFGLGETLFEIYLSQHDNICREDCMSTMEIKLHKDGVLIDDIIFETLQEDNTWIKQSIRSYQFYYWGEIDDYETQCNIIGQDENGTDIQECSQIKIGSHEDWIRFNAGDEFNKGIYKVKLDGKKKPSRTVDWKIITQGKVIDELAVWGGRPEQVYDEINDSSINNSLWIYDLTGYNSASENNDYLRYGTFPGNSQSGSGLIETKNMTEDLLDLHEFTFRVKLVAVSAGNEWGRSILKVNNQQIKNIYEGPGGASVRTKTDNSIWKFTRNISCGENCFDYKDDGIYQKSLNITDSIISIETSASDTDCCLAFAEGYGDIYYVYYSLNNIILNSPTDNYIPETTEVQFNCSAEVTGGATLTNMSLWTNESGVWEIYETNPLLFLASPYINWSDSTTTEQTGGSYKTHVNQPINNYIEKFTGNQYPTGSFGTGQVKCRTTFTYNDTSTYMIYGPTTIRDNGYVTNDYINPNKTTLVNNILYECNAFSGSSYLSKSSLKRIWAYAENNTNSNTWIFGEGGLFNSTLSDPTLWTCQACDSDGDCGFATENRTLSIDLDAPQITVESPAGTLDYGAIGQEETLNITFNDTNLESCWYDYNGTNITIDGCLNGIKNSTTFTLEENNLNMTLYANDSAGNLNSTFINWSYTYLENNRTHNTQSYETQSESFNINIEGASSVSLFYNGTEYTTTKSGNNFNRTIQIPISQVGNNSIYWRFNDAVNSYISYQTVNETVFTLCNATYSTTFLNVSFKDEANSNVINASIPASTFDYWLGDGTVKKTYNYINSTDNYNYEFCATPNLELNTDIYIQYKQGSDYPQRIYDAEATALTNTTTNLILYLLGVSDGLYVTFQTFGGQSNALRDVDVTGTRVISGSTTTVAQGTTDAAGTVTFWLNPDFLHTLTFIKTGYETVIETLTPTQTLYTITMGGEAAAGVTNHAGGISITTLPQGSFLDTNTFYTFTYTIDSSILSLDEYGFELFYNNGTSIYSDTDTTSTGGTLDKNFNTTNESRIEMTYYYTVNGTRINGTTYWLIYQTNDFSLYHFFDRVSTYIDYNIYGIQGDDEGYFAKAMISILILILVTGTLSMRYGLASDAAVTGLLFGVIFMLNVFNLIPTPDFLTFINLGDFLVFLIALIGIVTIIKEEGR